MLSKLYLLSGFLFVSVNANAILKPQVGLGYSDNVNIEQTNKDADFFIWTRLLANTGSKDLTLSSRLQYRDYFQQNVNDTFQWRLALAKILSENEQNALSLEGFLGHIQYTHGNASTTENAYNNTTLGGILGADLTMGNLDANWEFGLQFSNFPDFNNRNDREVYGNFGIEDLNAYLGFIQSTDSYFSKTYLEISYDWNEKASVNHWQSQISTSLRYSFFPNRKLYETVRTSTKKGGTKTTTTQIENETQMLLQIGPSLSKNYGTTEAKIGMVLNSQTSRSHEADYFETVLLASIQKVF